MDAIKQITIMEDLNRLYDIEDDAIDRGDSSNLLEAFETAGLNMHIIEPHKAEDLGSVDSIYHNSYYLGKGKYGSRALRMSNKEYHKLNG